MDIKEKIKKLLNMGYSYRQLATICDIHHTTLSNWCAGKSELTPRILARIESGLKDYLIKIKEILEE